MSEHARRLGQLYVKAQLGASLEHFLDLTDGGGSGEAATFVALRGRLLAADVAANLETLRCFAEQHGAALAVDFARLRAAATHDAPLDVSRAFAALQPLLNVVQASLSSAEAGAAATQLGAKIVELQRAVEARLVLQTECLSAYEAAIQQLGALARKQPALHSNPSLT